MADRYTVDTVSIEHDIVRLRLLPESADQELRFTPGQYAAISFRTRGGRWSPVRCFSIVSAPHEPQLEFAMRHQGRFTSAAARLQPGDHVRVQGPFGEFVIDSEYDKRLVLLAGGIGITPYISMLRALAASRRQLPVLLLYGNRAQATIPFFDELRQLEQRCPWLTVIFFVSDGPTVPLPNVQLERGRINAQWLDYLTKQAFWGSTYFVCGPKGFLRSIEQGLFQRGVATSRIVTEAFSQAGSPSSGRLSIGQLTYALTAGVFVLGFGGIMALDLKRHMPAVQATSAPAQSITPQTTPTDATPANTTLTTPTDSQPMQQPQYRQPISTVS